jgi:hypothetical protein
MERFPLLRLEEEGRLNALPLRENFIERVSPVGEARQGLRRKAWLSDWQFCLRQTARSYGPECWTKKVPLAAWPSSIPPTE